MKRILILPAIGLWAISLVSSCQEDFVKEIEDRPTDSIEFQDITISRDSVCMFDTIVLTANARGENLKYVWQRAKGSLAAVKDHPEKVYFWGCQTCCGDLTVSCTVENEFGSYTKDVSVFVYPWYSWQEPWPKKLLDKWLKYLNNRK